jgi:hypothetical protein
VVISDRKKSIDIASDGTTDYYLSEVKSYTDFYAFGSIKPGRVFQLEEYRFGHQGQEKEGEISGEGSVYSYEYRMNDARIGRFFSIDPLEFLFPHNSPYAFSENRVVDAIELEGLQAVTVRSSKTSSGKTLINITINAVVYNESTKITGAKLKTYMNSSQYYTSKYLSCSTTTTIWKTTLKYTVYHPPMVNKRFPYEYRADPEDPNSVYNANPNYKEFYNTYSLIVDDRHDNPYVTGTGQTKIGYAISRVSTQENLNIAYSDTPKDWTTKSAKKFGVTTAHEIGHGIGLLHPEDEVYKYKDLRPEFPYSININDESFMNKYPNSSGYNKPATDSQMLAIQAVLRIRIAQHNERMKRDMENEKIKRAYNEYSKKLRNGRRYIWCPPF